MVRFRSIISRITVLHIVAVVATCVAMPAALYYMLDRAVTELHERALRGQALEIADALRRGADGEWRLELSPRLKELYSEAYGRYGYAVVEANGNVLFTTRENGRPLVRQRPEQPSEYYFERDRDPALISGASLRVDIDGEPVWIQVGEDMTHRDALLDDVVNEFFGRVGWITAPILLLLLVIEIVIVRRGLQPMIRASALAAQIGPATVDLRLPTDRMPRELAPLVAAVNGALNRLEHGFRAQREFTADAAHELRTPLAILRAHIDTIEDRPLAASLRQDIDAMSRLVAQLLDIAELDTLVIASDEVADLTAVCGWTVNFLKPLATAEGKQVEVIADPEPVLIWGNQETLGRAVRNLVENALRHTAPGTRVVIRLTDNPAIHVADRGPGIAAEERDLVFQRFWRRDRRGGRGAGSAGLGLSIVSRIVAAHGGRISIGDNPDGGAVFTIRFPASSRRRGGGKRCQAVQAGRESSRSPAAAEG
jgi:signal transduction histidine kinase